MVEVSNNFIQECEANVGTYKFGKIKVNYIDDNPFNYEQGAYSSSNGAKIDAEQSIRYNKLVECEPNFKYKIELGNSAYKMKIVTYNANQAFIAAHDNLAEGSELTTESTAAYISVTIYSNDTLEGTAITLNNTIKNSEILGAELKGNTTQNGTPTPSSPIEVNNVTGEQIVGFYTNNYLNLNDNILWKADDTLTKTVIDNDNIEISYSGESATYKRLWQDNNLEIPDGTYSLSATAISSTNVVVGIGIDEYPHGSTTRHTWYEIWITPQAGASGVRPQRNDVIIDNSKYYYRLRFFLSQSTGITSNTVRYKDIMLKKADNPIEYEIYKGKKYEVNLGKNLIEPIMATTTQNGITCTNNGDGSFTLNGTATANIAFRLDQSWWNGSDNLKNYNGTYTLSCNELQTGMRLIVMQTSTWSVCMSMTGNNIPATSSFNKDNCFVYVQVDNGKTVDNLTIRPMLTKYGQATDFSPYFTPIELNKIGDHQDFIKKGTGKNLLDASKLRQGAYHGRGDVQNRLFIDANYYLSSGTYTFFSNFDTSRYRVGVQVSTTPYPNELAGNIYDSGWKALQRIVFTINNSGYLGLSISTSNGSDNLTPSDMSSYWFMVCEGSYSEMIPYEPYACTGKNLFDKNTQLYESNRYIDGSGQEGSTTEFSIFKTYLEPNTTYTLTNSGGSNAPGYALYNSSGTRVGGSNYSNTSHITFTTTSDTSYMLESVVTNTSSTRYDLNIFQIEKGSTATSYEPYIYSTLKDKWYIEKNIGKVVFNGSETWNVNQRTSGSQFDTQLNGKKAGSNTIVEVYSNYFIGTYFNNRDNILNSIYTGNNDSSIRILTNIESTTANFKTWLSTHNTIVYYVLSSTTYTLIENEELIEQLDAVSHAETQEGTTNITSSGMLPAILEVTPNLIESIRGKQTTPIVGYNITGDDDLINFKITSKADSNGNILGATSQSQVDIEIFNENNTHNLENKQVYISTGLAETEGNYCKWQPFTITQTKDTQTKNHTTYTGYDDMMRGNEAYVDNIDYGEDGITLYDFTCNLAKEMGMALANTTMTNGEFVVKGNNFTNNETKLVVLKNIAQMVGGFAMIDRDNLLRIVELSPEDAMTPIELTTNLYTEDFQNSAKFGEINEFAIGETNIETNAIVRSDDTSIAKNGVKKIEILDNIFLGLLEDKEAAIEPLWDAFNGFSYYPFKTPYNGYPYMDLGDKINITDINSNIYGTLVLNNVFEYNGGYKGNIGAEALSITAAKYKTTNTLSKQFRKVGIDIDRVEGEITAEIAAREDTTEQLSQLSQTVNEINSTVSTTTTTVSDLETRVQTNETSISQNADSITATVTRVQKTEDDVETLQTNTEDVVNQLVFGDDGLTISAKGTTSDDMKLNLTNDAIKFLYQNNAVLTINGSVIEFSNASFKKLDLGNYVWQAEDDDSLSLIYEGD